MGFLAFCQAPSQAPKKPTRRKGSNLDGFRVSGKYGSGGREGTPPPSPSKLAFWLSTPPPQPSKSFFFGILGDLGKPSNAPESSKIKKGKA